MQTETIKSNLWSNIANSFLKILLVFFNLGLVASNCAMLIAQIEQSLFNLININFVNSPIFFHIYFIVQVVAGFWLGIKYGILSLKFSIYQVNDFKKILMSLIFFFVRFILMGIFWGMGLTGLYHLVFVIASDVFAIQR